MTLLAFDFFCGAGGLTRGLLDAGINVVTGLDKDERCKQTFEENNHDVVFAAADIQYIDVEDLKKLTEIDAFENFLFAACAPCQPFSSQRKGLKRGDDATLLLHFGRLVMEAMPKFVLVENVPGITKVNGFSTYRRFLRLLEDCGYSFTGAMLNAKNFGVPQNRRRLVLIAMLGGEPSLPEETHGNGLAEFETVRDTISDYPPLEAGEASSDIPNHVAAAMSELNIERIRATDHDGGDRRSWPDNLRLKCHSGDYSGFSDTYGRMRWDSPAPTLTGRCNSISNGRYGHPEQDRAISLREAAALQTFPDNYTFYGSNKHIALQIGNAVPVKFAEVLGTQITAMTNSADNRSELRKQNCRLRPC